MTICAHRFILHTVAEPRHAEVLAQAEHDRRVRQAAGHIGPRFQWADRPTLRTVAGKLALLLAVTRQSQSPSASLHFARSRLSVSERNPFASFSMPAKTISACCLASAGLRPCS